MGTVSQFELDLTRRPGTEFPGLKGAFPQTSPFKDKDTKKSLEWGVVLEYSFSDVYVPLKNNGITSACERLDRLDEDVKEYSASLNLLVPETEAIIQDIEDTYAGSVRGWNLARTICALVPLLITWVSLALATLFYKGEPAQGNSDSTQIIQSFLAQWQSGFGNPHSWFTFSNVAFCDFFILAAVVYLTWQVHRVESKPKNLIRQIEPLLDKANKRLLVAIEQKNSITPSTAQSLVQQAATMISQAVSELKTAAKDWAAGAKSAEKTITAIGTDSKAVLTALQAEIKTSLAQTQSGIQKSLEALKIANEQIITTQMKPLLASYQTTLTDFEKQVTLYTAASTDLVAKVGKLGDAADLLAAQATSYNTIASDISANLAAIHTSQTTFVGQVTGAATDMKTAATDMKTSADAMGVLVTEISTKMQPQLAQLTKDAATAGRELSATQGELATTSRQLTTASSQLIAAGKALEDASDALGRISPYGGSTGLPRMGFLGPIRWLITGH